MAELTGEQFTFYGYEITTDTSFHHGRYGVTPDLAAQLEKAALGCQNKKDKRMVEKLTNLVKQYPHIPMFKNYLMVAYRLHGNRLKADEISDRIIQEHPDYLFGKINQAHNLIENGETEKVPLVLGESLELKNLYSERKIFHYAEYTKYLNVVIRYYVAIKNLKLAELKLDLLAEIAPDDPVTEQAESYLWMLRLERFGERLEEEHKQRITPVTFKKAPESGRSTPPVFNHNEINNLYQYGMEIPHRVLEEILTLPSQTLTEDLLTVLNDAADRYYFFRKGSGDGKSTYFPIHALFLLMELKAEETLPAVLSFLEYDTEFQEFWLGDHRTNTVWRCIFQLGRNNLELLQQFLRKPGIDTYSKTLVTDALCQMVLHHPEIRPAILNLFSAVFKTFAESEMDDNLIDTDFIGLAIGSSIDCRLTELLPLVKILFEKKYVALQISGVYSEVEEKINSTPKHDRKKTILSVFELYDKEAKNQNYSGGNDMLMKDLSYSNIQQSINQPTFDKTGRNDPCPCGSGRKYKKCCMK